jgi:hypothetical protein
MKVQNNLLKLCSYTTQFMLTYMSDKGGIFLYLIILFYINY